MVIYGLAIKLCDLLEGFVFCSSDYKNIKLGVKNNNF